MAVPNGPGTAVGRELLLQLSRLIDGILAIDFTVPDEPGSLAVAASMVPTVFDLAGVYPLKMRVAGVFAPTGTPDDEVRDPDPTMDHLVFATDLQMADVFFTLDSSGSMGGEISNLRSSLQTVVVPGVLAAGPLNGEVILTVEELARQLLQPL